MTLLRIVIEMSPSTTCCMVASADCPQRGDDALERRGVALTRPNDDFNPASCRAGEGDTLWRFAAAPCSKCIWRRAAGLYARIGVGRVAARFACTFVETGKAGNPSSSPLPNIGGEVTPRPRAGGSSCKSCLSTVWGVLCCVGAGGPTSISHGSGGGSGSWNAGIMAYERPIPMASSPRALQGMWTGVSCTA